MVSVINIYVLQEMRTLKKQQYALYMRICDTLDANADDIKHYFNREDIFYRLTKIKKQLGAIYGLLLRLVVNLPSDYDKSVTKLKTAFKDEVSN